VELHSADAECIVVERVSGFDEVLLDQGHELQDVIALRRIAPVEELPPANPTPWQIVDGSFEGPEGVSC
jgi:hypothetical protein